MNWFDEELLIRSKAAEPNEACGVIVDESIVVELPNVHSNPREFFTMDPEMLVDVYEEYGDIDGVWHSHPNGNPWPSSADTEYAPSGKPYYIVANGAVHRYEF